MVSFVKNAVIDIFLTQNKKYVNLLVLFVRNGIQRESVHLAMRNTKLIMESVLKPDDDPMLF